MFDDETVILGGMGIGDDFRHHNVDFMVEISGGQAAARLADRYEGRAAFDPEPTVRLPAAFVQRPAGAQRETRRAGRSSGWR